MELVSEGAVLLQLDDISNDLDLYLRQKVQKVKLRKLETSQNEVEFQDRVVSLVKANSCKTHQICENTLDNSVTILFDS